MITNLKYNFRDFVASSLFKIKQRFQTFYFIHICFFLYLSYLIENRGRSYIDRHGFMFQVDCFDRSEVAGRPVNCSFTSDKVKLRVSTQAVNVSTNCKLVLKLRSFKLIALQKL